MELTPPISQRSFWTNRQALILTAVILLASFLPYLPSLGNGFVNWDDQANIYQNPQITGITDLGSFVESIKAIFSADINGNYNPLSIATFALEKLLFGLDNPTWYHLNNILLHLLCVVLVFRLALALDLDLLPAACCALLFGIQPMRVESVAWVTERKDVLYSAFYLLALHYYIKALGNSSKKRFSIIILTSFLCSLLAKIQAVALPLSMLLVDYYFERPLKLKLLLEKWHYFAMSLAAGLLGIYLLRADGSIENNALFSFPERLFIGTYSYLVYLIKSLVPYRMVPVYPYPAELTWPFYASILGALALVALIVYAQLKKQTQVVFGLLFFSVNIVFMLQIIGAGQGFIADRFSYIAYFGLFFLYAYALQRLLQARPQLSRPIYAAVIIVLSLYAVMNYQQNKIWKNGETLWTHVLKYYPQSSLVWENRGDYYREQGRIDEAIADFSQALALKPNNPIAAFSRAKLYLQKGDSANLQAAVTDLSHALQLSPQVGAYHFNRGQALLQLERPEQALADLQASERLEPNNPQTSYLRAQAYFALERYAKAQAELEQLLGQQPDNAAFWSNLGTARRLNQQYEGALKAFQRAIELAPDRGEYSYKRALTYYEMGQSRQARRIIKKLKAKGFAGINPAFEQLLEQQP